MNKFITSFEVMLAVIISAVLFMPAAPAADYGNTGEANANYDRYYGYRNNGQSVPQRAANGAVIVGAPVFHRPQQRLYQPRFFQPDPRNFPRYLPGPVRQPAYTQPQNPTSNYYGGTLLGR